MSISTAIARSAAEPLRSGLSGDVFVPGDAGYDRARLAWNLAADQWPAVVVLAASVADVVQAVRFARSQGMRIAPQATGHGAVTLESLEGVMLLKTSRLRDVQIYPATRTARAQAGAQWQDVTIPAGQLGLAALAGSSPNVGVVGYSLGGGIGWLARRYGLAANSVTAVELVTPDGRLVRADTHHERDLFWAVRGGGGSVGVVTALELTLYPVRELYAGALFFPIERSSEVLHAWRQWTDTVPDEVTSFGRILRFPSVPEVPERVRGGSFAVVEAAYLGDAASGAELIRPLRTLGPELDTFATVPVATLGQLHMDPEQPVPGFSDGALLADAPAAAIDTVVELAGPEVDSPLLMIDLRHLGGALSRDAAGAGAQPRIDANYVVFAGGMTPTPELDEQVHAHVGAVKDALAPWRAGYDYYNFVETPVDARAVLPAASYDRLRQIKAMYDPDQVIVSAHPVRPASMGGRRSWKR
jgi:FAD/FMN-containing dehydrogenase